MASINNTNHEFEYPTLNVFDEAQRDMKNHEWRVILLKDDHVFWCMIDLLLEEYVYRGHGFYANRDLLIEAYKDGRFYVQTTFISSNDTEVEDSMMSIWQTYCLNIGMPASCWRNPVLPAFRTVGMNSMIWTAPSWRRLNIAKRFVEELKPTHITATSDSVGFWKKINIQPSRILPKINDTHLYHDQMINLRLIEAMKLIRTRNIDQWIKSDQVQKLVSMKKCSMPVDTNEHVRVLDLSEPMESINDLPQVIDRKTCDNYIWLVTPLCDPSVFCNFMDALLKIYLRTGSGYYTQRNMLLNAYLNGQFYIQSTCIISDQDAAGDDEKSIWINVQHHSPIKHLFDFPILPSFCVWDGSEIKALWSDPEWRNIGSATRFVEHFQPKVVRYHQNSAKFWSNFNIPTLIESEMLLERIYPLDNISWLMIRLMSETPESYLKIINNKMASALKNKKRQRSETPGSPNKRPCLTE